jgi:hypothetical protein
MFFHRVSISESALPNSKRTATTAKRPSEALAVHVLFTRMVKMKLLRLVAHLVHFFTDREHATGSVIDLYSMAIVNDVQWAGVVIEFERRQVRFFASLMSMGDCV